MNQRLMRQSVTRVLRVLKVAELLGFDQQRILMSWLGSFLNGGDGCPNLQRAFEVWWRRSFVRPYSDRQGSGVSQTDSTSKE
uniref:At3g05675-like ankyrin-like domain-containing protein n=1 Tax=Brassica campestris TaxID=3711 RepID=M4FIZ5_BRACM